KSCLKAKGCTDAGTAEEPVDNFGQMTIFAQPDDGGANAPAQATAAPLAPGTATGVMTQVRGNAP
ncbi:type VI secretion system tube protein Hcp, partial [Salmonella enterica]|nr:type VI secretion system tube protein Hcp [Salmonella enterica]